MMLAPTKHRTLGLIFSLLCGALLVNCRTAQLSISAPPSTPIASEPGLPVPATQAEARAGDVDCPKATALEVRAIEAELTCLLQHYLRIDTTNPPGNELRATNFLKDVLASDGIDSEVLEAAPGRGNLLARLKAHSNTGKKAVMWLHHMDVVPASADEWSVPPFAGTLKDGYLWGRGSLDNKGAGITELMAFLLLKRLAVPLERDVLLLAVADEESGGKYGARWLVENHKQWFENVEFVLNEGGAIIDLAQGRKVVSVEVAQKAPLWLRLTARGPSGHGSTPKPNTAATLLVRALARLTEYRFPAVVVPEVQQVFNARAAALPEFKRGPLLNLSESLKNPVFRAEFEKNPGDAALVQNTVAITQLNASPKENVISERAEAVLDIRLLPGQDADQVIEQLKQAMGEPLLEVEKLLSWKAHASPHDTAMFRAVERLASRLYPETPVVANVIGGFTDCNAFRAQGIICYGFLPVQLAPSEFHRIHGKDERVSPSALAQAVVNLHLLLDELKHTTSDTTP
jgi:acetylornithine deacetylase/succinyl-diaminopimelate desuccinylase-like protein